MRMLLFLSLVSLFSLALHGLFYSRVVRRLLFSSRVLRILALLLGLNFLFNLLYLLGRYSDTLPLGLYYLASLSVGVTFVLLIYLPVHEGLHLLHRILAQTPLRRDRREFFKRSADTALLGLSGAYLGVGAYGGHLRPEIRSVSLGLETDLRLVQISDLHIGGLIERDFVRQIVREINALRPDLVCITGDLIDTALPRIEASIRELERIEAPQGIYCILGNHEYFHDPEAIVRFLRGTSLRLLLNESVTLPAAGINLVGVTDLMGRRFGIYPPDLSRAYRGVDPALPTILLAHQPRFLYELGSYRPDLILSGHTHGGQIWPFGALVRLQQPYLKGLHTLDYGGRIYVNSGVGFWGPPMRLGSQAEITLFT